MSNFKLFVIFLANIHVFFYEKPSVRSKEQFICVMKQHWERNSNCRTDLFNKELSYTTASKKYDFELSKLKEPLDSLTNNPSVKNITRLPVWNNHDKDKCFSCPVDFISISFTSFEGKKRSSKLVYSPTVHCTNHLERYSPCDR